MQLTNQTKLVCTQQEFFDLVEKAIEHQYKIRRPKIVEFYSSGSTYVFGFEKDGHQIEEQT